MSNKNRRPADFDGGAKPSFPDEAYDYNDDVTTKAVETIRARAEQDMKDEEWEIVDEFFPSKMGKTASVDS